MRHVVVSLGLVALASLCAFGQLQFNPNFFAHPAYVMQGTSDSDAIFAMPLLGVEELRTYPLLGQESLERISWNATTDNPDLINCRIEDGVLYIWGIDPYSSGEGSVELSATVPEGDSGSILIPVTVFRRDKTLIASEGKKDYFVPWSPDLDISRIASVMQHVESEGMSDTLLDASIRFSKYVPLPFLKDVSFERQWYAPTGNWTAESQRLHATCVLEALQDVCVDTIRVRVAYYMDSRTDSTVSLMYEREQGDPWPMEVTIPWGDLEYVIDEAHRLGMRCLVVPVLADTGFSRGDIAPRSWEAWFASYEEVALEMAMLADRTGVDILGLGEGMINVSGTISASDWNQSMRDILEKVRAVYAGPVYYGDQVPPSRRGQVPDW